MAELQRAADLVASGRRDPEIIKKAVERMDRNRESVRRKVGVVNAAVDLIRSVRDE